MSLVTVQPKQSLVDIAIQTRGTVKAVFELAVLNGYSVTDDLVPGAILETEVETEDVEIAAFYKKHQLKPATALRAEDVFNANPTGIDYMIIGTDFIVQ